VNIKIYYEDKCIILLCYFSNPWDSLVVTIGSNATTLNFYDVVSSLLSEEMRRITMDNKEQIPYL